MMIASWLPKGLSLNQFCDFLAQILEEIQYIMLSEALVVLIDEFYKLFLELVEKFWEFLVDS